jgi:deoxyribonuclease-4
MTKIFLGPAGNCVSAEEKGTVGSLKRIKELGLNCQEIEFVRSIYMNSKAAGEVGNLAKQLGIELSVHASYFVNLGSTDKKVVEASKQRIWDSVARANDMGARIVVFHPGYYSGQTPEAAFDSVKKACEELINKMKSHGIKNVALGLETTGKTSQWGTLDETIELCKELKGCKPAVDPAHIYARQAGRIVYKEIFDKLAVLKLEHIHMHFSGVKWRPVKNTDSGNEWYHIEIKSNQPPFEPLAKEVLKRKLDITIISESPALEQDSLVMRKAFEKLGYRFL